MLQTQGDHIAECIATVRERGFTTIDPTEAAEEWWVQEVIAHRGKTSRNHDCTPGYYNFEGESNRRQDGNYNGGFRQYWLHQGEVRARMEESFELE
jgi:cyclohexanone monooxygenase